MNSKFFIWVLLEFSLNWIHCPCLTVYSTWMLTVIWSSSNPCWLLPNQYSVTDETHCSLHHWNHHQITCFYKSEKLSLTKSSLFICFVNITFYKFKSWIQYFKLLLYCWSTSWPFKVSFYLYLINYWLDQLKDYLIVSKRNYHVILHLFNYFKFFVVQILDFETF